MPTHAEKRILPFSPEQLFDIVADIEKYPEFLPWCIATRVRRHDEDVIHADMVIGFKMFRERFTTKDVLDRPRRIDVSYHEGPFKYLNNHWIFEPHGDGHCELDFYVDFEFHSRLFQKMVGVVFNEAVRIMVTAFEKRAKEIYGSSTVSPNSVRS